MKTLLSVQENSLNWNDIMPNLNEAITTIKGQAISPNLGLKEDIFLLVSELTPLVNVDLLIKNDEDNILLTWRSDQFYGSGWHIPGGIVRFKEKFETRIHAVAKKELNATLTHHNTPLMISSTINETRNTRGHFISLLFNCKLTSELDSQNKFNPEHPQNDQWAWHSQMPDDFLDVQKEIYSDLFKAPRS